MTDAKKANRSSEELRMRDLIVPEMRRRWPDARIIHELPLRYSSNRIDLAAVTETAIISVEIKSIRDVADRLEAQLRAFDPISALLIVALAPKWNEQLPPIVEERPKGRRFRPQYTAAQAAIGRVGFGRVDVWTVDAAGKTIDAPRQAGWHGLRTCPWLARMLDMLWVEELRAIAGEHRVSLGPRATHWDLVDQCHQLMTGREIIRAVCRTLRSRDAFAAESDPPITARHAPLPVVGPAQEAML